MAVSELVAVDLAVLHHEVDSFAILKNRNVGERVAIDDDQVGQPTRT